MTRNWAIESKRMNHAKNGSWEILLGALSKVTTEEQAKRKLRSFRKRNPHLKCWLTSWPGREIVVGPNEGVLLLKEVS